MATVSFQIPDDKVTEYVDAFSSVYNYDNTKLENETKTQFARRKVREYMQEVYRSYKINTAVEAARQANIDATIDIT